MRKVKKIARCLLSVFLAGMAVVLVIIGYVMTTSKEEIASVEELKETDEKADAVIVLGAQVKADGSPSVMLKERLDKGIEIYQSGLTDRIIMSGDHGSDDYKRFRAYSNKQERGRDSQG